jgi:hypothetical protein
MFGGKFISNDMYASDHGVLYGVISIRLFAWVDGDKHTKHLRTE